MCIYIYYYIYIHNRYRMYTHTHTHTHTYIYIYIFGGFFGSKTFLMKEAVKVKAAPQVSCIASRFFTV